MASRQQYRNEKKAIDEAVAKVREVVHSASKNDIILALHNFDIDVERTIQAFCDDGAQSALNSWERTGSSANKKKHPKKKNTSSPKAEAASTLGRSASPTDAPASLMNGSSVYSNESSMTNGTIMAPSLPEVNDEAYFSPKLTVRSFAPDNSSISKLENRNQTKSAAFNQTKPASILQLESDGEEYEKMESLFSLEMEEAEKGVREAFKEIRHLLADREKHLLAEIERLLMDGSRLIYDCRASGQELNARFQRIGAMSDREQSELRAEMARFESERAFEEGIGSTKRFICDNSQLMKLIKNFGEVIGLKGPASGTPKVIPLSVPVHGSTMIPAVLENSASHSSIHSSVGEDSGLEMMMSVINDDRKNLAEVSNGGILMKSDELSTEQLAELNKKLQETLKAQGIDSSVLAGVGGFTAMPVRRRPPGGNRGSRGGANRAPRTAIRVPELSILQT